MSVLQGSPPMAAAGPQWSQPFDDQDVRWLRHELRGRALSHGLTGGVLEDFVSAVYELTTNAVRHGGGHGVVGLRRDVDVVLCVVSDQGPGFAGPVPTPSHPPPPDASGGRGLWLAHQLTDGLLLSSGPAGVTASVVVFLAGARPARPNR